MLIHRMFKLWVAEGLANWENRGTGRSKQIQYKQMSMVQHCVKAISTWRPWRLSDLKNLKISCETCSVGSREIACMISYGTPLVF